MDDVKIYKGSDIPPPPPKKARIIRPSRNFLWKNYFLFILTFFVFSGALVIVLGLFGIFIDAFADGARRAILFDAFYWIGVVYVGIWIIISIIYFIGMYIYVRSMKFIVHGHEIVVHKGLINKSEKHVPYRTVTHIDMRTGPFDRIFSIGTIEIQTAGGRASSIDETAEEKLEGIKVYREVRDYILTQLRQFQAGEGQPIPIFETKTLESIPTQMLAELKEIKTVLNTRLERMESKLDKLDKKKDKNQRPY
ncbi:MAG: PH domain-containing protein [Candidatus Hodarchaeales archaeon]|jgi:membrane protein YdbS with pleckstrin-like domain